jgi:hypothetical protein
MNAQFQRLVLRGIICDRLGVWDPIPFAEVLAIPSRQRPTAADAPTRRESKQLSREEMEKMGGDQRVVRGRTDENGEMEASFGPAEGAWDVYVCIRAIRTPGGETPTKELREEVCLFAGTYAFERGRLAVGITSKLYCLLKRRADWWTIAGRVTLCDTDKAVGGVTVTAMDTDWLQHDNLGSAVTNASGIFRIDYPGSKFRQGTWLDLELFGGPDVFFRIVDGDGNVLLNEPPSAGRGPGRHDRGACFCVNLCVQVGGGDDGDGTVGEPSPNAWVSVGSAFEIPTPGDMNDFDADGYAGAAKFALYSTVTMRGYVGRLTGGGNPIEYRFRTSTTTAPNGGAPVAEANFTRNVDGTGTEPLFATTFLGHLVRTSPFKMVAVHATAADLKAGGWLNVNDVVQAAFAAEPGFAGLTLGVDVLWGRGDALMGVATPALTTHPDVPAGAANAGAAVPAGSQIAIEKFAFRFDIREVAPDGTPIGPLPHDGTTLNAAVVNNNPIVVRLALSGTAACEPQSGSVELAYTVYHPHLQSAALHVRSNDWAYNANQTDAPPPADGILPLSGNTNPARTQVFNPSFTITPALTQQCGYLATLSGVPRLHTGDSAHQGASDQVVFFWS